MTVAALAFGHFLFWFKISGEMANFHVFFVLYKDIKCSRRLGFYRFKQYLISIFLSWADISSIPKKLHLVHEN